MNPVMPPQRQLVRAAAISVLGIVLLVLLEFTNVDRSLARLAFDSATHRFPLQDDVLLGWLHAALRVVAALTFAWILAAFWWPIGPLRRLPSRERTYLLVAAIVCLIVVSALKRASALHCPWDLAEFGGRVPYLHLFDPVPHDWVRGSCFPAGHVLSAFAFIGGYFAFAPREPILARRWLLTVLLVGALAGAAQQVRGAHFLTHTLWSLWWCWTLSALLAWLFQGRLRPVNNGGALAR